MRRNTSALLLLGILFLRRSVVAFGVKLPKCPDQDLNFSFENAQRCTQAREVIRELSDCRGSLSNSCCAQLDWFLAHRCHCWGQNTADQRHHVEGLLTQCASRDSGNSNAEGGAGVKLFVGVLTAAKNQLARQAIRDTWGSDSRLHRVLFFSAKPRDERVFDALRKEAVSKGDIVVLPTIWESYYNISHQTLEVLRASSLDLSATHTLKADDDSYVRVDKVLSRIRGAPPRHMFMGFIESPGGGPHRNPSSQWYVTPEEWPTETYPPWAHGAGYVLSQDLVQQIAAGAALKPQNHQIFKLEDIALGSWIEYVAKENRWGINYVKDTAFNFNGCGSLDVVSHYVKPRAMRCMFKNSGSCCSASTLNRPHLRGGGT